MSTIQRRRPSLASLAMAYADQSADDDTFEIPEDLSALSDEDLDTLTTQATDHFGTLYGDGTGLSDSDLEVLAELTEGIELLAAEGGRRSEMAAERDERAAALAARVLPADEAAEEEPGEEAPAEDAGEEFPPAEEAEAEAAETITAAADNHKRGVRVPMSNVRKRMASSPSSSRNPQPFSVMPKTIRDVAFGADSGAGMNFDDMAGALDKRLGQFNTSLYQTAANRNQHMREQGALVVIKKPFRKDQMVMSADPDHVAEVVRRAVDESRLPQGSLVASGGWCAPSEVLYDLLEGESRDGLLSVPEIGITRGGIMFTQGPSFQDIYEQTGFCFTEDDDINGRYQPGTLPTDPNVVGPKPCYHVTCPEFEEARLDVCGLCITSGLLQQKGYPEVLARTIRGALIAHDHKMSARITAEIVAGSTAVAIPGPQAGATAPILTAIELQTEHYRYVQRLSRNTTLEAVFPYWVHGAIRSDLSRRLGVELMDVPDSRIDGWFRDRGIAPQFVYDWQALAGDAAAFTAWPTSVQFLLYQAGTWVRGSSDVITLDTIYDSVMLGTNDFTALFTEEGWFAAKRGHDSRVVTVPITTDGATHAGVLIEHNGTLTPAP
jgi:hypothetical protein